MQLEEVRYRPSYLFAEGHTLFRGIIHSFSFYLFIHEEIAIKYQCSKAKERFITLNLLFEKLTYNNVSK